MISRNICTKFSCCSSFTSRNLHILVEKFRIYVLSENMFTKHSECISSNSRDFHSLVEHIRNYVMSKNICTKFTICSSFTSRDLCSLVKQFLIHLRSAHLSRENQYDIREYVNQICYSQQLQSSTVLSFVLFVCTLQLVIITGYMHAALYILFAVQQSRNQTRWENEREARRGVLFLRLSRFSNSMPKLLH